MRAREIVAVVFGATLVVAGCSTPTTGSDQQASCPQAFYVNEADAGSASEGPLPDDQCTSVCGKPVFSCAIASVDGGTASVECQPSCSTSTTALYGGSGAETIGVTNNASATK